MPMLRLVAKGGVNGGPMTPDYEAQAVGLRRFIGRRLDTARGQPFRNAVDGTMRRHAVFVALDGVEAVHEVDAASEYAAEYIRHLKEGDLLPGDEYTAERAGVKFDPAYQGAAMWGPSASAEKAAPPVATLVAEAQKLTGKAPVAPSEWSKS